MDREETPLKQIRTFQGDVAEAIQKQQESLVSIQRAEHLRRDPEQLARDASLQDADSKRRKEFFFLFLGSLVLLALGTLGAWFAYNEFTSEAAPPSMTAPANRFISANAEINLDLATSSRELLIDTLSAARDNLESGQLRHIVLRNISEDESKLLSMSAFLKMLESRAPGSLVRALDPLFMFGAVGESPAVGGASVFLIIKLTSFENAFAGMLAWEKNLAADIGPLFATAKLLRDLPPESSFVDIVDRNKDIRILAFENQPILLYSFFGNNMLIITDRIETLRTLIDRLTREKLSR